MQTIGLAFFLRFTTLLQIELKNSQLDNVVVVDNFAASENSWAKGQGLKAPYKGFSKVVQRLVEDFTEPYIRPHHKVGVI